MARNWIKKMVNFTPKLIKLLENDAQHRGMNLNALIRQIIYEYYHPKTDAQAPDVNKIKELLDFKMQLLDKSKDLEMIKKRLDILISQNKTSDQHLFSEILAYCESPKTLFESNT